MDWRSLADERENRVAIVYLPGHCVDSERLRWNPKGRSYGQKTMSEAAYSMLDVMLANGMWIGQKNGNNIAVSWVDRES